MIFGAVKRHACDGPGCGRTDRPLYLIQTGLTIQALCDDCKARRERLIRLQFNPAVSPRLRAIRRPARSAVLCEAGLLIYVVIITIVGAQAGFVTREGDPAVLTERATMTGPIVYAHRELGKVQAMCDLAKADDRRGRSEARCVFYEQQLPAASGSGTVIVGARPEARQGSIHEIDRR